VTPTWSISYLVFTHVGPDMPLSSGWHKAPPGGPLQPEGDRLEADMEETKCLKPSGGLAVTEHTVTVRVLQAATRVSAPGRDWQGG